MTAKWQDAGTEPAIEDLLRDPMVHAVMKRDGIDAQAVHCAVVRGREGLAQRSLAAKVARTKAAVNAQLHLVAPRPEDLAQGGRCQAA